MITSKPVQPTQHAQTQAHMPALLPAHVYGGPKEQHRTASLSMNFDGGHGNESFGGFSNFRDENRDDAVQQQPHSSQRSYNKVLQFEREKADNDTSNYLEHNENDMNNNLLGVPSSPICSVLIIKQCIIIM